MERLKRALGLLTNASGLAALVLAALVLVLFLSGDSGDGERANLPDPDSPPLEHVYLDNARVLAYLGQIEQGLASTETRNVTEKSTRSGTVRGHNFVELSAGTERQRASQEVVTQTEADRFFTLLRFLRDEDSQRPLAEVDAQVAGKNTFEAIRAKLRRVEEGDFIRIRHAQLFLPSYAAVYPKVRYVEYYRAGSISRPRRPLYAPVSSREREDVVRYRERIGPNPRLPFIVRTLDPLREARKAVSFLLPLRHDGLTKETSLLAGTVTVVGKVVYKDPRLPSEVLAEDPTKPYYFDRQTLATFGPALERAPRSLLHDLGLPRRGIAKRVSRAVQIPSPVLVVIPLAIYQ